MPGTRSQPTRAAPSQPIAGLQKLAPLVFTDIAEREAAEEARINDKIKLLHKSDPAGAKELEKRKKALAGRPFDTLLVEVVEAVGGPFPKTGKFPSQTKKTPQKP